MLKLIFLLLSYLLYVQSQQFAYEKNIIFRGQNAWGNKFTYSFANPTNIAQYCPVKLGSYTILVHGWTENYNTFWVHDMINRFASYRKGCVFFMDFSFYSEQGYVRLVNNFNGIQAVLTKFLKHLESIGYSPDNGWLFSFSYGAHVAFEGAYQYGYKRLARLDACDPVGLGFRNGETINHAKFSAKAVQCLHTSGTLGTNKRYCQFDMNLGNCGKNQPASSAPPVLSHGLCPVFYNNSIVYDFKAVQKPAKCEVINPAGAVNIANLPKPILMGVRFNTKLPTGEYYFPTSAKYPYN